MWWGSAWARGPLTELAVAVVEGKLYAIGGCKQQLKHTPLNVVESFDPLSGQWTPLCPMNESRHAPGVAVLNNVIHVIGGAGYGGACNSVECFHPAVGRRGRWTNVASMGTVRCELGAVAV